MALSSAFQGRLEQMECTRNQRLSLLQAEKEVQANKSQMLASKHASLRLLEQRCLLLDQKVSSQSIKISSLKFEIDDLDAKYQHKSQNLRILKCAVKELEETEKEKESFYELNVSEMKEFRDHTEGTVREYQFRVDKLRQELNKLSSTYKELQGNNGYMYHSEIAAAEVRKLELLDKKEIANRNLASNHQIREQVQIQLHNVLFAQNHGRIEPSQCT